MDYVIIGLPADPAPAPDGDPAASYSIEAISVGARRLVAIVPNRSEAQVLVDRLTAARRAA